MNGSKPTAMEQAWLDKSVQVPCLACMLYHGEPDTPAEYHHITGQRKPNAHLNGFSLCEKHHRLKDNNRPKRWISRHGDGKKIFEQRYMPEKAFLKVQQGMVARLDDLTV